MANAVATLSGQADAFESVRKSLGVDSLDISSSTTGGPLVSATHAINDRVERRRDDRSETSGQRRFARFRRHPSSPASRRRRRERGSDAGVGVDWEYRVVGREAGTVGDERDQKDGGREGRGTPRNGGSPTLQSCTPPPRRLIQRNARRRTPRNPAVFQSFLAEGRPLLADGATGTNLFAMGLTSGDAPELWNADHADRIESLHRAFVDAGADIVLTNSFGANRRRLMLHGLERRTPELNRVSPPRNARKVGRQRWAARRCRRIGRADGRPDRSARAVE